MMQKPLGVEAEGRYKLLSAHRNRAYSREITIYANIKTLSTQIVAAIAPPAAEPLKIRHARMAKIRQMALSAVEIGELSREGIESKI